MASLKTALGLKKAEKKRCISNQLTCAEVHKALTVTVWHCISETSNGKCAGPVDEIIVRLFNDGVSSAQIIQR
jgi:hypothetical protein